MDALRARPAIDRERLSLGVCMSDNQSGIFRLVSPMGQVYRPDRVLLDSGAQPLMLGKPACIGLGIRRLELELCPFQIQTSLGGISDRSNFMTRERLSMQMKPDHVTDSSRLGVIVVVTAIESYDVLVGGAVLYLMGFQMDYWTEITTYRPGWQSGDGRMSQVPARFIYGAQPRRSPPEVLASVASFSGVVTWPCDLLEGNISAIDTPVYEDIEEVSRFVTIVSSSLDVPFWRSSGTLRQDADRLVSQAWREAFVPVEEEEVPQRTPISGPVGLSPLDTTPIAWEYPFEGICVLNLFGGINTGLAIVLQVGILVQKYLYVERDEIVKRVSSHHLALLMR